MHIIVGVRTPRPTDIKGYIAKETVGCCALTTPFYNICIKLNLRRKAQQNNKPFGTSYTVCRFGFVVR